MAAIAAARVMMMVRATTTAMAMVTTAKDAVKIPTEFIYSAREIPLYILNMDICITEGMDKFKEYIDHAIKKELDKK